MTGRTISVTSGERGSTTRAPGGSGGAESRPGDFWKPVRTPDDDDGIPVEASSRAARAVVTRKRTIRGHTPDRCRFEFFADAPFFVFDIRGLFDVEL